MASFLIFECGVYALPAKLLRQQASATIYTGKRVLRLWGSEVLGFAHTRINRLPPRKERAADAKIGGSK
jgi:hypothetical protein